MDRCMQCGVTGGSSRLVRLGAGGPAMACRHCLLSMEKIRCGACGDVICLAACGAEKAFMLCAWCGLGAGVVDR